MACAGRAVTGVTTELSLCGLQAGSAPATVPLEYLGLEACCGPVDRSRGEGLPRAWSNPQLSPHIRSAGLRLTIGRAAVVIP